MSEERLKGSAKEREDKNTEAKEHKHKMHPVALAFEKIDELPWFFVRLQCKLKMENSEVGCPYSEDAIIQGWWR